MKSKRRNMKLTQYNIEQNKSRAIATINQMKELEKNGIRVEISPQQAEILAIVAKNGYLPNVNEYLPYIDNYTLIVKKSSSSSSEQSATSKNNNSKSKQNNKTKQNTLKKNSSPSSEQSATSKNNNSKSKESKMRSDIKCNFNEFNQFNTLYLTITTSDEYKTTNIKEFKNFLDEYFKNLSKDLKKVIVKYKNESITYTYDDFSIISVISCTKQGYLYFQCLLIFEDVVTKIAPKILENGSISFDFDNNIFKSNWEYGSVHIKHYLNGLDAEEINNVTDHFVNSYREITKIKNIKDKDMLYQAENKIDEYLEELSQKANTTEKTIELCNMIECKDMLIEECYRNLLELREQQRE